MKKESLKRCETFKTNKISSNSQRYNKDTENYNVEKRLKNEKYKKSLTT